MPFDTLVQYVKGEVKMNRDIESVVQSIIGCVLVIASGLIKKEDISSLVNLMGAIFVILSTIPLIYSSHKKLRIWGYVGTFLFALFGIFSLIQLSVL